MPTPLAHGLMGAMIIAALLPGEPGPRHGKTLLIGVALGVAPDLDVLLSLMNIGDRSWHHDFTHSIAFAFLSGWLVTLLLKKPEWKPALIFGTAMLTHPLLDFIFTSSDGVELFWPLSEQRFRLGSQGFGVYRWNHHSLIGRAEDLLAIVILELMLYGSVLAGMLLFRSRRSFRRSLNLSSDEALKQ